MFNNLNEKGKKLLSSSFAADKDAVAQILKISPEAMEKFEESYQKYIMEETPDDIFDMNSRHAASKNKAIDMAAFTAAAKSVHGMKSQIVDELLAQTEIYCFDGTKVINRNLPKLPENTKCVQMEDINALPKVLRPQLTGNLMKVDIKEPSYDILMWFYSSYLKETDPKDRQMLYHLFRQGLDILDLDNITYDIIGTNPNSMGKWFPQLVEACKGQNFFKLPATTIAKVPLTLLQLTRQEYSSLTKTTLDIVDEWAYKTFNLDENKEYFIKTGTYSSKFDFRNAHVHGASEVRELGEYLLFIHFQALLMASPLTKPCIYGVSTTNEWVVREFIADKENNPCIYKGMPLHTEYRVFVDCDTDLVIGVSPYWEPETMLKRFGGGSDANSPHQIHDYVIYKAHESKLMQRYEENFYDKVVKHIQKLLPRLDLKGQWSIDVMQNGDDFYIIDMAIAENSAFYECVPKQLRNPSKENWIPELKE